VNLLLNKWGAVVSGEYGIELVLEEPYLFSVCSLHGDLDTGISGITFERPQNHPLYPELVFDLLSIPNSCYFEPDLDFVYSRMDMNQHYPDGLLSNTEATIITDIDLFQEKMNRPTE